MGLSKQRLLELTGCQIKRSGEWFDERRWIVDDVQCFEGIVKSEESTIPARLLLPPSASRTGTGVLYAHAHGNRYEIGMAEVTDGRPSLLQPPVGLWLAKKGHTVLCLEMTGFGKRQSEGTESALSKKAQWNGRPLLGLMLDDLGRGFSALSALPGIAPDRIATFGISMGATLSYWFAALEERVARCAHLCAFASIGELLKTGAHDLHGHYMTVPGLLSEHDMGDVAALVAPRPQLIGVGLDDPLTPKAAFKAALAPVAKAYGDCPEWLETVIEPSGGHAETPAMRSALKHFLALL